MSMESVVAIQFVTLGLVAVISVFCVAAYRISANRIALLESRRKSDSYTTDSTHRLVQGVLTDYQSILAAIDMGKASDADHDRRLKYIEDFVMQVKENAKKLRETQAEHARQIQSRIAR